MRARRLIAGQEGFGIASDGLARRWGFESISRALASDGGNAHYKVAARSRYHLRWETVYEEKPLKTDI